MATLSELEKRIERIEKRNFEVEAGKSWETSLTRRVLIALFTYLVIGFYMLSIGVPNPWLNAVIPTTGFVLSTLSMPYFKKFWIKYIHKRSLS